MPRVEGGGLPTVTGPLAPRERSGPVRTASFEGTFHLAQVRGRLDELLSQIDAAGEALLSRRTIYQLKEYKGLVAAFLREVQSQAYRLQQELEWDHRTWEHRTFVTVKRVNEALEELAEQVLAAEAEHLDLLAKLGEIKGLLLDLKF